MLKTIILLSFIIYAVAQPVDERMRRDVPQASQGNAPPALADSTNPNGAAPEVGERFLGGLLGGHHHHHHHGHGHYPGAYGGGYYPGGYGGGYPGGYGGHYPGGYGGGYYPGGGFGR
ncbi:hypothetical protein PVAND_003039 [Polypedilum vanderplanki]|uniref:Glycine rich protein n=1 Tax=Polypedilum vanderplanki TaxID=319348 RepID=A0A9J6BTB7_POLVA|nr:hypothetical protein PVAND_003039 [Polypedilum vanderplanki]